MGSQASTGTDEVTTIPGPVPQSRAEAKQDSGAVADSPVLCVQAKSLIPMQSARATSVLYAEPVDASGRLLPFCKALRKVFLEHDFILDEGRDLKLHATIVNTLYARPQGRNKKAKSLPPGWGRPAKHGLAARGAGGQPGRGERRAAADTSDPANGIETAEEGSKLEEPAEESTKEEQLGPQGTSSQGKIDARWLIQRWKDNTWAHVTLEKVAICEMGAKADENGTVRYKEIAEVSLM